MFTIVQILSDCPFYETYFVLVKSKRGAEISTLYLDSPASQWELQQDLGVLAHQAFPLELR